MSLNIYDNTTIGNDLFALRKVGSTDSAVGFMFDVTLPPRCDQYQTWFRHELPISYMPLDGTGLIDIEGTVSKLQRMVVFDVPAGKHYRFRGTEFSAIHLLAFSPSPDVVKDWREAAATINGTGTLGRDGITRFK